MPKARDHIGPYRLTRLIRNGAYCQVWEATPDGGDEKSNVALKIMRESYLKDKDEVAFHKNEYEIASGLKNPNLIKVLDFGVDNGVPYTAMELFSSTNFKNLIRMGVDSYGFMLQKMVQKASEGLYFMHSNNWIHRDVKPENFLVNRDAKVKLIDYRIAEKKRSGLSKLFGKSKRQGTLSYISPEQIRAKGIDQRSDIYSFGCMLFELTTGKLPFTANTPNELLNKHLSANIPSAVPYNANVTSEFADLVKRMMAKTKEDRHASMWEFLKEFRAIQVFKKPPRIPEVHPFDRLEEGELGFNVD